MPTAPRNDHGPVYSWVELDRLFCIRLMDEYAGTDAMRAVLNAEPANKFVLTRQMVTFGCTLFRDSMKEHTPLAYDWLVRQKAPRVTQPHRVLLDPVDWSLLGETRDEAWRRFHVRVDPCHVFRQTVMYARHKMLEYRVQEGYERLVRAA